MYDAFKQYPLSFNESLFIKIVNLLMELDGYNKEHIQWDRIGISKEIYMKYKYWEKIYIPFKVKTILEEERLDDDNCGMLYKYILKLSDEGVNDESK